MARSDVDDGSIADLPPTAETVVTLLRYEGSLSRQALLARTARSADAVDRAVSTLESRGHLSRSRNPDDLREVILDFEGDPDT